MSDFEFPVDNKKTTKKPAAKIQEEVQFDAQAEAPAQGDVKEDEPKPVEKKYDEAELAKIFDEILFTGEYVEEVVIRGKLRVSFKTRNAEELAAISRVIDGTSYTLVQTMAESRMVLNLQYALQSYQGKDLSGLKVEERALFVRKLAGPLIGVLVEALIKFDEKVAAACKDLEENF